VNRERGGRQVNERAHQQLDAGSANR
jgi:hypothetical protein